MTVRTAQFLRMNCSGYVVFFNGLLAADELFCFCVRVGRVCVFLFQSKFVEELAQQGRIRELILDQYANYVVQRALTVASNEEGLKLVAAIRPHLHSMQVDNCCIRASNYVVVAKLF